MYRFVVGFTRDRHRALTREDGPQGYMVSYQGQIADFANAVLNGEPPAARAEFSLGELRTALAMARSPRTRRWEKVWD